MSCGCDDKDDMLSFVDFGEVVPSFTLKMYDPTKGEITDYTYTPGKWTVLCFYPADFTFVCPTELADLADKHPALKGMNVDVFGISTDTAFAHMVWLRTEKTLSSVKYPLLGDSKKEIAEMFGVLNFETGMARRATLIIDPKGHLVASEVVPGNIGRSADDLVRKVEAMQYVEKNPNVNCQANWKKGDKALDLTKIIVGDVFNSPKI